jgi:hypothetical protein
MRLFPDAGELLLSNLTGERVEMRLDFRDLCFVKFDVLLVVYLVKFDSGVVQRNMKLMEIVMSLMLRQR